MIIQYKRPYLNISLLADLLKYLYCILYWFGSISQENRGSTIR